MNTPTNEPTDPELTRILAEFKQRIREQTIAELYHQLKGQKVSMNTLAEALGTYPMKIERIIKKNTTKTE